jgi:hypothetical protein
MAAGNTYEAIATTTLSSTATNITFSSIPATYTDLIIVGTFSFNSSDRAFIWFNGDTGSNYSQTFLYGNGTSALSTRNANYDAGYIDNVASAGSGDNNLSIMHFMNYANTTTYKTTLIRTNHIQQDVSAEVMLWRSTSAINQIAFRGASGGSFAIGSVFSLYGIKAA